MSTSSIQQRTLALPQRPATLTAAGLIAAALMAGTAGIAYLISQESGGTELRQWAIERPAGRGEMEYPGIEATIPGAYGTGLWTHSGKGGLMELPDLQPPAAALGEARGGEQEYPGIR